MRAAANRPLDRAGLDSRLEADCRQVWQVDFSFDFHSARCGWLSEPNQVRVIHALFVRILFRACLSTLNLGIIAESKRFLRRFQELRPGP